MTNYTYDALGNLSTVTQSGNQSNGTPRIRNFVYDFRSLLVSATNPESVVSSFLRTFDFA